MRVSGLEHGGQSVCDECTEPMGGILAIKIQPEHGRAIILCQNCRDALALKLCNCPQRLIEMAKRTPLGAEEAGRGKCIFNWLIYCAELLTGERKPQTTEKDGQA